MFVTTSSFSSSCTLSIHTNIKNSHPKFYFNPIWPHNFSNNKDRHPHLSSLQANSGHSSHLRTQRRNHISKMDFVTHSIDIQAGGDLTPLGTNPFDSWTIWLPGILVAIILPFFANKWGPFAILKERVDSMEEMAEEISDVIEEVAKKVDKVAEDISDSLPEGGRLRKAADFVEDVAERVATDAHWVGEIINKVEEVEEKVESLIQPPKIGTPNSKARRKDKNNPGRSLD